MPIRGAELLYGHARRILEMVEETQHAVGAFLGRLHDPVPDGSARRLMGSRLRASRQPGEAAGGRL